MSERVKAYFAMLESLSSEDLDRSARELALREKQETARLIAHIAEIGERAYHLELGYKSLFDFRFGAGKEFTEKFKRLAEVLGIDRKTLREKLKTFGVTPA